jgi:hypothetical protein
MHCSKYSPSAVPLFPVVPKRKNPEDRGYVEELRMSGRSSRVVFELCGCVGARYLRLGVAIDYGRVSIAACVCVCSIIA